MVPFVIIPTKGRAQECRDLIQYLANQTLKPKATIFVGVEDSDVEGIQEQPGFSKIGGIVARSEFAGGSRQRNVGIDIVVAMIEQNSQWFITFFDDDFRPSVNWLESAANALNQDPSVSALTGQVLADGIFGPGIEEAEVKEHLVQNRPDGKCWAQGDTIRLVEALYGCNMAIRGTVFADARFDERLPLYSWQEDRDFSFYAKKFGKVIYHPSPRGVHMGSKRGRNSGLRMGYSQIANIIYLRSKHTISLPVCFKFLGKAIVANSLKSFSRNPYIDYPGRLRGNLIAFSDIIRGRLKPERILAL